VFLELGLAAHRRYLAEHHQLRARPPGERVRGLPIDDVASALNQRLPLETPINLGPGARSNDQWAQRLIEGLYPRRVRTDAAIVLDLVKLGAPDAIYNVPQGSYVLIGKLPPRPAAPVTGMADLELSWTQLALEVLAALGWGAAVLAAIFFVRRRTPLEAWPLLGAATVAAACVFGVLATSGTVAQRPLPWRALQGVGLVLALAAAALLVGRSAWRKSLDLAWLRRGEVWAAMAFSALATWHVSAWPVVGRDGRSIWLYHARQIAHDGFLRAADAVNMENFFSHMEYPLLFPAWLTQFTFQGLQERQMIMGAPALFVGLFACLWVIARRALGRWTGAALAGAVFFGTVASVGRGFAEAYLSIFLLLMIFCLDREDLEPLGWLAALAAALTKREGLVFAAAGLVLFVIFHPRFRRKRWFWRPAPLLALVPGIAHAWWTRAIGIKDTHAGAKTTWRLLEPRVRPLLNGIMGLERASPIIALGTAALFTYVLLEIVGHRSWLARMLAGTGFAVVGFSALATLMSPYDVNYMVSTALERLLAHGALCFLAAVVVALARRAPSSRRGRYLRASTSRFWP
jgi:hypothetical protein